MDKMQSMDALRISNAATGGVLWKKEVLEISQNSQENTCARASFIIKLLNFIKKKTLAKVFSREFCENSKSIFLTEHLWMTAWKGSFFHIKQWIVEQWSFC